MPETAPFRRIAVIGTGLIGGSFALAVRKQFPEATVSGWDRDAAVLDRALARGSLHRPAGDLAAAVRDADLVYLALPVHGIVKALGPVAEAAPQQALVTDAGSTKLLIEKAAGERFGPDGRFLGGHPVAGKENSGIENADPELFRGAPYALIGAETKASPRAANFVRLISAIGARPVWCDAAAHDRAVALVSHLPQMLAIALAQVIGDETASTSLPLALAGQGLQDSLRLAGSPYRIWRDILASNGDQVAQALDRLVQAIEHLAQNLNSAELEAEFRTANELYKKLRK